MDSINVFTGVGVAGMSRTLHAVSHVAQAPASAIFAAYAAGMHFAAAATAGAAAFPAPRKRRTATATAESVNRGTT
jgi:hypothetical protein